VSPRKTANTALALALLTLVHGCAGWTRTVYEPRAPLSSEGQQCLAEAQAVRYRCASGCGEARTLCLAQAHLRAERAHEVLIERASQAQEPGDTLKTLVVIVLAKRNRDRAEDRIERAEEKLDSCVDAAQSSEDVDRCFDTYQASVERALEKAVEGRPPPPPSAPSVPSVAELELEYARSCPPAASCNCDASFSLAFLRCGGTFEPRETCLLCP
jgi:hypothetical protein